MIHPTDAVHSATTAAGIIAELEALEPGASYYVVPTRIPEGDAVFVEALRSAEHPITRENLLRLVRELHIPGALEASEALLADAVPNVRGEAADTVGGLASYSLVPASDARQAAARAALLARWDVEADDMVRSCLAYSLVALAEPRLRPLFEACLTDRDDRVRRLGRDGLRVLGHADPANRVYREGTDLQGAVVEYDYGELAQIIHRHCCETDPYGFGAHPRQRHIRRVLEYGYRERLPDQNTVIIRGRFFDLILEEDRPAGWVARVTDPAGISPCRRPADHRHRLLLRPLSSNTDEVTAETAIDVLDTDPVDPAGPTINRSEGS